jgi:hypothetical protein
MVQNRNQRISAKQGKETEMSSEFGFKGDCFMVSHAPEIAKLLSYFVVSQ